MPNNYISPISMDALSSLCSELGKNNSIKRSDFEKYHVRTANCPTEVMI